MDRLPLDSFDLANTDRYDPEFELHYEPELPDPDMNDSDMPLPVPTPPYGPPQD